MPSTSKFSHVHRDRVRQLVAQEPEDALAHELGGEEALGAVGDLVGLVDRGLLRAGACGSRQQRAQLRALRRRSRGTSAAKLALPGVLRARRATSALSAQLVDLVQREDHAAPRSAGSAEHRHRRARPSPTRRSRSTTTSTSDATCPTVRFISRLSAFAVLRLVARRIDEDELRALVGEDAEDAMARGLRLARGDRDVRTRRACSAACDLPTLGRPTMATVPVLEGLLAHAVRLCLSCGVLELRKHASAAACSGRAPARAAAARDAAPRSSTRHSTMKVWSCASPSVCCTE